MRPDGICQVTQNHYTKTIQFRDINYQLSDNEDKQAIFDGWCDFLNYFDSSVSFQLSFINLTGLRGAALRTIPVRTDQFESIQRELSEVIRNQQEKGNNGIVKTKYLTFGIDADSVRSAKPRLERIETDILNNFKKLGVSAQVLNGQERLKVCHDILRMDTPEPFLFRWEDLPRSGLSTKDYIAPSSFYFGRARDFRMGKKFATVSFLQILAPELSDRVLKDFLDIESNVIVNIHVQSVDQVAAIKTIKRTITDLDKTKIEEQKKAVRAGYDMDILPSDLATYGEEAKKLLSDLQSRNQRMFLITFLILNTADTKRQLDNNFLDQFHCPEVQLPAGAAGLSAGRRHGQQSAFGAEPNRDSAGAYFLRRCHFCTLYNAGAFSEQSGGSVLRHQCPEQQHHHGGPEVAEKPQRSDSRHPRFRQILCRQTGNRQRVSGDK